MMLPLAKAWKTHNCEGTVKSPVDRHFFLWQYTTLPPPTPRLVRDAATGRSFEGVCKFELQGKESYQDHQPHMALGRNCSAISLISSLSLDPSQIAGYVCTIIDSAIANKCYLDKQTPGGIGMACTMFKGRFGRPVSKIRASK